MLDAAEWVLKKKGVDAATLRAIADRAGLSMAIVYRRFRDKDSVLRAVYQRFFAAILDGNRRALSRAALQHASTDDLLPVIVRGIAEGYRRHRQLLRPLVLYARTHPDAGFRKRARRLNAAVYDVIRERLLQNPGGIRHPNPEVAVAFAISAIAAVLQERVLFDDAHALPALAESDLVREATRMLRCYLGLAPRDRRALE